MSEEMKNQPATIGVVAELRSEMISCFHAVYAKMDSRFKESDAKMDTRFKESDAKMESRFHELKNLIEEQNAKNSFVLEGLNFLKKRQDRLEERQEKFDS